MISAGRVLIVPRGNWNKDTTYHMLDMVNYNGYAYLAKRTVIGIEPEGHPDEWHNMLAINEIIENAMADVLAESVGKLLEERFAELLSEARYVTNLFDDYDVPTFVRWDGYTENTPYKAGLTACYEGFALVHGKFNLHHTVSAWVTGGERNECFIHTVTGGTASGWDRTISASGGTMVGPLGLGSGKGKVHADDEGTYLESVADDDNSYVLAVKNSNSEEKTEDAVQLIFNRGTEKVTQRIFGEHNVDSLTSYGYAKIASGVSVPTYIADGFRYDFSSPTLHYKYRIELPFKPKVLLVDTIYINYEESNTWKERKYDDDHIYYKTVNNTFEFFISHHVNTDNNKDETDDLSYIVIG